MQGGEAVSLVKVAEVAHVPAGAAKVVHAEGKTLALFNVGGTFYATDNKCTHVGGPLGEGRLEGNVVICPWHGSRFNVTTGQVVGPPARQPVSTYPVRIQGEAVYVELPESS